jgi:hypothetical protein
MTSITTTAAAPAEATTPKYGAAFFEHLWRGAGVQSVAFFLIGLAVYTIVPDVGAYIAAPILGLAILNLTWWMAALRTTLADHGLDGWGAAGTTAAAGVAGMLLVLVALGVTIASVADTADPALVAGLTTFGSAAWVLSSFPRAMFVMAGSFGFWRAQLITDRQFVVAVGLVILGVLGGTTLFADGIWSPTGALSLIILPALELVWVVAVSRVLNGAPSTRTGF